MNTERMKERLKMCRRLKAEMLRAERKQLRAQGYVVIGDPRMVLFGGDVWPEKVRQARRPVSDI